jgi:hypothetical protein
VETGTIAAAASILRATIPAPPKEARRNVEASLTVSEAGAGERLHHAALSGMQGGRDHLPLIRQRFRFNPALDRRANARAGREGACGTGRWQD